MTPDNRRRVRVCYFNVWAGQLEDAVSYVARVPAIELASRVSNPHDVALLKKARLDCDWYGENARCFSVLSHPELEFLPAWVGPPAGAVELVRARRGPLSEP